MLITQHHIVPYDKGILCLFIGSLLATSAYTSFSDTPTFFRFGDPPQLTQQLVHALRIQFQLFTQQRGAVAFARRRSKLDVQVSRPNNELPKFRVFVCWYIVVCIIFAYLIVTFSDYSRARKPETNRARLYVPIIFNLVFRKSFNNLRPPVVVQLF